MEPQAICDLAEGNVARWRGLDRLERVQLPACLGPRVGRGTHRFGIALLARDTYRADSGRAEVRVYSWMNSGRVALLDVHLDNPPDAGSLLEALGGSETTFHYTIYELEAFALTPPQDGHIEEAVYGARGLSLVLARNRTGAASVLGLRGFDAMPARRYLVDFVRSQPNPID